MAKNKTDDKQTTKIKIINDFSEQARTLDDAKHMLKKYRKSVIIRPTGFGKTWLLTELIKDYDKVLNKPTIDDIYIITCTVRCHCNQTAGIVCTTYYNSITINCI